jgi:hypothetical protein
MLFGKNLYNIETKVVIHALCFQNNLSSLNQAHMIYV